MSKQVTLASNAVITLKKWRVRDVTKLAENNKRASAQGIQDLLAGCTEEVLEPGPYKLKNGKLDWAHVGLGDQVVAKIALFAVTFSDKPYEPEVTCPECQSKMFVPIDVEQYLEDYVVPYPASTLESLTAGVNRFSIEVGGVKVVARILDGKLQKWAEKHVREGRTAGDRHARQLGSRVVEIDGVTSRPRIVSTINGWGGGRMNELIAAVDEIDGGVDTEVTNLACIDCGNEFDFDLPFDGEPFWTPSQRQVKRKRSKRTRKAIREAQATDDPEEFDSGDEEKTTG